MESTEIIKISLSFFFIVIIILLFLAKYWNLRLPKKGNNGMSELAERSASELVLNCNYLEWQQTGIS